MEKIPVYVEIGQKKSFAGVLAWPGWSRAANTPEGAIAVLAAYAPRYAGVLAGTGLTVPQPKTADDFTLRVQLEGSSTTDFGAPAAIPEADHASFDQTTFERSSAILAACWQAFLDALVNSEGIELRKGPRGGGRDQAKMADHVIESHRSYLRKLGWKPTANADQDLAAQIKSISQADTDALTAALNGRLPEAGPRGGKLWPVRYFVRRAAWHILDHLWEIEDRRE